MTDILMPALSPTMEEGNLTKWHVKAGDTVKAGDVIAEIETDKATMEVEAVDEGEIAEILVAEGSEGVKVNTPIARMAGRPARAQSPPLGGDRRRSRQRGASPRLTRPPRPLRGLSPQGGEICAIPRFRRREAGQDDRPRRPA